MNDESGKKVTKENSCDGTLYICKCDVRVRRSGRVGWMDGRAGVEGSVKAVGRRVEMKLR